MRYNEFADEWDDCHSENEYIEAVARYQNAYAEGIITKKDLDWNIKRLDMYRDGSIIDAKIKWKVRKIYGEFLTIFGIPLLGGFIYISSFYILHRISFLNYQKVLALTVIPIFMALMLVLGFIGSFIMENYKSGLRAKYEEEYKWRN